MAIDEVIRIYVDTNVLINYCTGQAKDTDTLNYIFKHRRKEVLFTSSLAIVQTIANLQTKKKTRNAFSAEETIDALDKIFSKFTILNLTADDIKSGYKLPSKDIEDNIHYILCRKGKCNAILTNNVKDFSAFNEVEILKPDRHLISLKVQ